MTANDRPAATRVTLWAPDELVLVLPDDAPAGLCTGGGAGTPTQPLVAMRFTDANAIPGKTHRYRVFAVNTAGLKSAAE